MNKIIAYKNIVLLFLWVMSIQYIPLEGDGVSYIKLTLICLLPLIWFLSFKTFSKGFVLGSLFIICIIVSSLFNAQSIRFSSLVYKVGFIVLFMTYYDLIHVRHALSLETFQRFIKKLIYAYAVCLIIQQFFIFSGIKEFPLINLVTFLDRDLGANSLALEPSHSARILTAAMLVFLRLKEVSSKNQRLIFSSFVKDNIRLLVIFFWCMLTMGSGTAIVGLLILFTYFVKKEYLLGVIPFIYLVVLILPQIDYEPVVRAVSILKEIVSLDVDYIKATDYSAAARIVPFLNTINYIDFTEFSTWLGNGIDTNINANYLGEEQYIGGIRDYGLICYFASLLLFFACCVKKLLSTETLVFTVLLSTSINNVAYVWAILMLFTTSTYYYNNSGKRIK